MDITELYESARMQLLNSESLIKQIESVDDSRLRARLMDFVRTIQVDLLELINFLIEVQNSVFNDDLETLLELNANVTEG